MRTGSEISTAPTVRVSGSALLALGLTVPIAIGAIVASLAGVTAAGTYAQESPNWAGQAVGQDVVNLVIYPMMLLVAWRASRGSAHAYVWWLGATVYSVYSYLLYAGFVHFSGWFLVYVVTFGASVFAAVAGAGALDPVKLKAGYRPDAPVMTIGGVLAGLGAVLALLWLSEIVPAVLAGDVPQSVIKAGLVTNPVWVLDLGVVLPAMIAGGLLLRRRRPAGYALAGPLLAFGIMMGIAIIGMLIALAVRGEPLAWVPLVLMGVTVLIEAAMLHRLQAALHPGTRLNDVLRSRMLPIDPEATVHDPGSDLVTLGHARDR